MVLFGNVGGENIDGENISGVKSKWRIRKTTKYLMKNSKAINEEYGNHKGQKVIKEFETA